MASYERYVRALLFGILALTTLLIVSQSAGQGPTPRWLVLAAALAIATVLESVFVLDLGLVIGGMLLITFAIAFLGLSNMLTLSVFERVREITLLRAIGTRKSRIRRAIAYESGATALLGALLGLAVGIPFGLVAVRAAIGRTAATEFVVSGSQLVAVLIVTLVVGTIAAALPSIRAMAIQPAQGLLH